MKKLKSELNQWLVAFLDIIPGGIGNKIRYIYYSAFLQQCGKVVTFPQGIKIRDLKNIVIGSHVNFGIRNQIYASGNDSEKVVIGSHVTCNSNVMINADCGGEVIIGDYVSIAPNVVIRASNHNFVKKDVPINQQGHSSGKIQIDEDVWIGSNAVILPNVHIHKGAVIAAGAVVTKDVESFAIVGGVPAKNIGMRGKNIEA